MPEIIIYTTAICPYCNMAKRFLTAKGVRYREINVDTEPGLRTSLIEKTQRHTVPQIYIGEHHIGGFDDMVALDRQAGLEPLLAPYKS